MFFFKRGQKVTYDGCVEVDPCGGGNDVAESDLQNPMDETEESIRAKETYRLVLPARLRRGIVLVIWLKNRRGGNCKQGRTLRTLNIYDI